MSSISPESHAQFAAEINPDVGIEKIASVYAESFLSAAEAKDIPLGELVEEFDSLLGDVYTANPRFEELLGSALVSMEDKIGILDRVFGSKASPLFLNFLKVLTRHGRLEILRSIRREVQILYDRRLGRIPVTVTTASPLPPELADSLLARLRGLLGGEPILNVCVDPEVIGGILVRVGDTIYDASIQTKLKNVRQQMIDRSAHEIQSRRDRFRNPEGN